MFFEETPIQSVKQVGPEIFLLSFPSNRISAQATPGQFVMVRPKKFLEPLLARPFSIYKVRGEFINLLFKVKGQGTRLLSELKKGNILEVRGPLGRGFSFNSEQESILVAGGLGLVPMLFLAEALHNLQNKRRKKVSKIFIGARTEKEIIGLREFKRAGLEIHISTEDGSLGKKGLVTQLLTQKIKNFSSSSVLFACGPLPMLKAIQTWAVKKNIECQLSLETFMACGVGVCLGCVVARKQENGVSYANVCKEGPVFPAHEVLLNG